MGINLSIFFVHSVVIRPCSISEEIRVIVVSGSPTELFHIEAAANMMTTLGLTISCLIIFINEDFLGY